MVHSSLASIRKAGGLVLGLSTFPTDWNIAHRDLHVSWAISHVVKFNIYLITLAFVLRTNFTPNLKAEID